jgi:hypothetical protein
MSQRECTSTCDLAPSTIVTTLLTTKATLRTESDSVPRPAERHGRVLRSEKDRLTELLNDPGTGLAALCNQLNQLEAEGTKLAGVYGWRKVRKRTRRLGHDLPDLILPETKGRRVKKEYQHFRDLEDAINAELQPYASAPRLFFNIPTRCWGGTESWQEERPKNYLALKYLLLLVTSGRLNRIRQCSNCGIWFLARREDQMCCGARCRRKQSSKDAAFKAGRREYMKKYRADEKNRTLRLVSTR